MASYIPRIDIKSKKDYIHLKGTITDLDKDIIELDFDPVIKYLESEYEEETKQMTTGEEETEVK